MPRSVDDQLHCISTLILSTWQESQSSASGFFYDVLGPPGEAASKDGSAWRKIEELWLVTNRHVLVNSANKLASSITFHHRKITKKGFEWVPITISGTDLHNRCRFHQSDDVDVAVVRVLDLLSDVVMEKREIETHMAFQAVSEDLFPGIDKMVSVGVGDDALIVCYPRGFYDDFSKFPIVKSGVIASRWDSPFGGKPYFLIDAKLFPGSSGSIVISRPIDFVFRDGRIYQPPGRSKTFLFLGILSGEPFREMRPIETDSFTIISKEGYNVGVVWYYHLVPAIISEGKQHLSQAV